jgi:hypothetical protein
MVPGFVMVMTVVAAFALAGIGSMDEFPVKPGLHESTRLGRRNADHNFNAGAGHALLGAAAHASGEEQLYPLRAEPVGPTARLGFGRYDSGRAHYKAARPIDLEEAGLGGATEMGGELVVLGEGEGDDHGERGMYAQNARRLEARR